MTGTKAEAEAVLRGLPHVVGAHVNEDVHGHPREIHLLVGPGPEPALLSTRVRELLEERLGLRVDQRVISIAQLTGSEPAPSPDSRERESPGDAPVERDRRGAAEGEASAAGGPEESIERLTVLAVETSRQEGLARVSVILAAGSQSFRSDAAEPDVSHGVVRAAARATLRALTDAVGGDVTIELEGASVVLALDRPHVLVSALALSRRFGRRPRALAGAHPIEERPEVAAVLAALKASNRTVEGLG